MAAWIVVMGSSMMLMCTFGMMSTIGVLQTYWETHQLQEYSSRTIGWIPSAFVFLNLSLGVQIGPMFDRYGPRWMMIVGSVLYALSIFMLGSCEKYYQFLLCLGILGGVSSAMVSTPCMAVLSHWFHRRRGTATGVAMAGSSLGGIIFPLALRAALKRLGWTLSLRILGSVFVLILAIGNITIRSRLPVKSRRGNFNFQCFTDSRFIWATAGAFCTF
jgi:MFS family permease